MLAKIQQEVKAMKEADIFESWAARLVEGTWALPDTPEKMTELKTWFSQPQPLGPDAENVTDVLYPLLGDDALFDQLAAMASEDPDADAIPIVQAWVTRNKDQSPELSELAASFETAAPTAPPAPPAVPAAPPVPAAPAAPAPPAPVAEAAKWRDPKYQGKTFDYDDSYEGPHDTKAGKVSLDRAGMRQIDTFDPLEYKAHKKQSTGKLTPQDVKYATAKNFGKEKQQQLDYDRSRKAEQDVAEGEDDSVDLEPKIRGLKSEFNKFMKNIERTERDPAYADKADKRYEKMSKRKHPLQQPDHEVDEGDNLETFEDIIRLSGAPLKENVLNDSGSTLDYIIKTYQRDIKDFVQNGDMSEHLYDALYDYYQDDMPYGVKKARSGDPYEWVGERFYDDLQGSDMVDEGGITLRTGDDGNLEPDPTGHTLEKQMALRSTPEPYTGPTAGGAPTNLPAGINRLTGKPNAPVAPTQPEPVTSNPAAGPTILQKHYEKNPLVRGLNPKVNECNYTMENEYCPEHGLEECYGQGVYESELARIKSLARHINKDTMDEADYDLGYQDNQLPFVDPRASYVMPANAAEREQDLKDFGHLTKNLNLGKPASLINKNVTPSAKTVPFGQNNRTTTGYDMPANDAERAADLKDFGPLTNKFNLGSNRATPMEDRTFDAELARIKSLSSLK
jgi:hypothetical protein